MSILRSLRGLVGVAAILGLSACAVSDPLTDDLPPMGNFELGYNIVVSENAQVVPPSRTATPEEWQTVLKSEIDRRFGAYKGGRTFHIAVNVDGYSLAVPGIPILLAPKSILVLSANVWDHELGRKLHAEPQRITVFEGASGGTLVGSGYTKSADEQMRTLSRNAAFKIQEWMLENPEWFSLPADTDGTASGATLDPAQLVPEAQDG